ncbi:hypothetical protein [Vibrio phage vB_pir03]|nr:hypothetical protein [Vibrio phage vB_pir03]
MSTTTPEILGDSGTIAILHVFQKDGPVDLEITLGATTTGATSINVEVKNLDFGLTYDTLEFTGLTSTTSTVTKTITVAGTTGEVVGLVANQTGGTNVWVDSSIAVPTTGIEHATAGSRNIWMSANTSLYVYEQNAWVQMANDPGISAISALGIDATSDSALVVDSAGNKIYRVTRDDVWTDVTNGEDVSTVDCIAGTGDTEIAITKADGSIRVYDGSAWTDRNDNSQRALYIQYDAFSNLRYRRAVAPYTEKTWSGSSWDGVSGFGTVTALHYAFRGTVPSDDLTVAGITNAGSNWTQTENRIRYGDGTAHEWTNDPDPSVINYQGGFHLGTDEHIVHDDKIVTVDTQYEINFEGLSVTEVVQTNGPHVHHLMRETILAPDAGPHVHHLMREAILTPVLAKATLQKQAVSVVIKPPPPEVTLQKQAVSVVVQPKPANLKLQKQTVSVVLEPLPPELKLQKQTISVVLEAKPAGPYVNHLVSEAVLKPDPGPAVKHIVSEAVLKPDPGPAIKHMVSEAVLVKAEELKVLKQTAYAVLKPKSGPNILKQSGYAVLKPKTGPNVLKQSAYAVLRPSLVNRVHKQSVTVLMKPKTAVSLHKASVTVLVRTIPLRKKRRFVSQHVVEIKSS